MKQIQMDVRCSLGRQTKSPMHISTSRLQSSSTLVGRRFMLLPLNSQPGPYGLRLVFKLSPQVIAGQTASNQSCCGEIALQSLGREASQSRGGKTAWFERQDIELKRFTLETWDLAEFALLGLGLAWDPSSFLLLYFSLFGMGMSTYACPTIVFWKHITCLVSQIHSWREILP